MTALTTFQPQNWQVLKDQASVLVKSGLLPEAINTAEKAIAVAMMGQEIGMPMMQAYNQINVIKQKPTLSAEGINFQIRKNCPGAKVEILERSNERCRIRATRPGEQSSEFEFNMEDAKRADLLRNPSWSKYPKAMLFSRCISEVGRSVFPDCLRGIGYTPEEFGAEVDESGNVINVDYTKPEKTPPEVKVQLATGETVILKKNDTPVVEVDPIFDSGDAGQVNRFQVWCLKNGIIERPHIEELQKRMHGKPIRAIESVANEYNEELKTYATGEEK